MGTLEQKWGPNGDPKTEKGPHGDRVPQMGTHVGTVVDGGAGRGRDFWGFQAIGLQTNTCESWSGRLCRVPFFGRVEWEERSGKKVKVLST